MKKMYVAIIFNFFALLTFAQINIEKQDSTQIKKDVKMTFENGQKVLSIETTSTQNGTTRTNKEVFTGEAADKKLEELKKENLTVSEETGVKKAVWDDVRYEEIDGYKKLTVIHNENGTITEKVYIGKEAEEKLKELQKEN